MKKYGNNSIYDSEQVIAVSDIHGESEKLLNLMDKILPYLSNSKCHLVFCGDYFDRGINSPKVFEILVGLKIKYPEQVFFIKGNHEEMLWTTLVEKENYWLRWTSKTLDQMRLVWGIKNNTQEDEFGLFYDSWDYERREDLVLIFQEAQKRGFIQFLKEMIPYYENSFSICTHAPIDGNLCEGYLSVNDNLAGVLDNLDLRWTFIPENTFQTSIDCFDKYLICGHQHGKEKVLTFPRVYENRAFIDTGCGCGKDYPVSAIMYPQKQIFQGF